MAATIVAVQCGALREAVYRFRYDVYVGEMRRRQSGADHVSRRLVDDLDDEGMLVAALDPAGRVIGTLRGNLFSEPAARKYERLYGLALTDGRRAVSSFTTRLMVAPDYRHTGLALALARARFDDVTRSRAVVDYIDCNDHLVTFFTRLGYLWQRCVEHPDYGRVNVMACPVDLEHLQRVASPLLPRRRRPRPAPAYALPEAAATSGEQAREH